MKRRLLFTILSVLLSATFLCPDAADAQGRPPRFRPGPKQKKKEEPPPRPTDPKLIEIHKDFLARAEKLAQDYERKKQLDKAREVYEAILRLVPKYSRAEESLARITDSEASADRKQFVVQANKAWQDTGVVLKEGKPVVIKAEGSWTVQMTHKLGPDGIEIPEELRDFNLGALVGVIVNSPDPKEFKPFFIGAEQKFIAPRTGKLMLRMYDSDPADNTGRLNVTVHSTFAK